MLKLKELSDIVQKIAPLSLSQAMIDKGDYDNSGIIVHSHDQVKKILFSLDLSSACVDEAIRVGADTVITHHPAIYNPVKNLCIDGQNKALLRAIQQGLNVISMHLNLDVADGGIDQSLCEGLGGKQSQIIQSLDQTHGYGRLFLVQKADLKEFTCTIEKNFKTKKIICYGDGQVNKVASFCGGGASHALDSVINGIDADTIVTSDASHHHITGIVESGKKLIIIPHYASENYGFNKFYAKTSFNVGERAQTFYFEDIRFM